jgi:hypothetical protein
MCIREGITHPQNFGVDWITSGFTPNIQDAFPFEVVHITRDLPKTVVRSCPAVSNATSVQYSKSEGTAVAD